LSKILPVKCRFIHDYTILFSQLNLTKLKLSSSLKSYFFQVQLKLAFKIQPFVILHQKRVVEAQKHWENWEHTYCISLNVLKTSNPIFCFIRTMNITVKLQETNFKILNKIFDNFGTEAYCGLFPPILALCKNYKVAVFTRF